LRKRRFSGAGRCWGARLRARYFYHWVFEADLIQRAGDPMTADMVVGTSRWWLVFEAARRLIGLALPIDLPGLPGLRHVRPVSAGRPGTPRLRFRPDRRQLAFGTEGIYGMPTYVSSTYIFLFILFGAFLEQAGMISLFNSTSRSALSATPRAGRPRWRWPRRA
jgi:TRAP-type uncharacterized transport system fused permease subunit